MMTTTVYPVEEVKGLVNCPPSKSVTQRVLAATLLTHGETRILGWGNSKDEKVALQVIMQAGARVSSVGEVLKICGTTGFPEHLRVTMGESGLSARMFTPILALSKTPVVIEGEGSLLTRPMHFFDHVFQLLAVRFRSHQGKLPFWLQGPLVPKDISVDGSLSSQFITGLLYAFAFAAEKPVSIYVREPVSRPYLMLTLDVLRQFGVHIDFEDNEFRILPGQTFRPCEIRIEGDWSGAAMLMAAAAISGQVELSNLKPDSLQADRAILQVLELYGAHVEITPHKITVTKKEARPFVFDATDCPDLFPVLAVLAAFAGGESVIHGTQRLTFKESNRALTLQQELGKLGIAIRLQGNAMRINGSSACKGGVVDSHQDHRIAMAAAVAALRATQPVTICQSQAVEKSYPAFYDDLQKLGVRVSQRT
ncbi:MAG: 3-phosphoshikimate 1-carboxyvinyltransferase [Chitinophagales bacterium]|nr:MAG: 3-phosphoshikimate 1-carboxyvinyltransferase [Chitinophagales bacterium]